MEGPWEGLRMRSGESEEEDTVKWKIREAVIFYILHNNTTM